MRIVLSLLTAALLCLPSQAGEKAKKVLLVTHSGGFIHSAVVEAEKVLKEIGPKHGFEITCFRYTNDPAKLADYSQRFQKSTKQGVTSEQAGRLTADTLNQYDAVFFFTTGNPVETKAEMKTLLDWVKSGHGFLGAHCATDTLYSMPEYGEFIGAYFDGHPWHTKVKVVVDDKDNPITKHLGDSFEITDEIYQFRDPYQRDKLRVLMRLDPKWVAEQKAAEPQKMEATKKALEAKIAKAEAEGKGDEVLKLRGQLKNLRSGIHRTDNDYAIAWMRDYGKGHVFYTALGHREEVWRDPRFQQMILQAMRWATGQIPAPTTPLPAN